MSGTPWYASQIDKLAKEKKELEAQRDELMEALKCISSYPEVRQFVGTIVHDKALSSITKAEGRE